MLKEVPGQGVELLRNDSVNKVICRVDDRWLERQMTAGLRMWFPQELTDFSAEIAERSLIIAESAVIELFFRSLCGRIAVFLRKR